MSRYVRVAIKGTLGQQEVWSVNPVFDPSGEVPAPWNQEQGDAAAQAIGQLVVPEVLTSILSSAGKLTSTRFELRDTTGDELIGVSEYTIPSPVVSTFAPQKTPQTAVVASLRTNRPGASGRGRLYWPALAGSTDNTTLKMPTTAAEQLSTAFSSYLKAIGSAILTAYSAPAWAGMDLSVYSRKLNTLTPVSRLGVGTTYDTQRRRRDAIPEVYSFVTYPPA